MKTNFRIVTHTRCIICSHSNIRKHESHQVGTSRNSCSWLTGTTLPLCINQPLAFPLLMVLLNSSQCLGDFWTARTTSRAKVTGLPCDSALALRMTALDARSMVCTKHVTQRLPRSKWILRDLSRVPRCASMVLLLLAPSSVKWPILEQYYSETHKH